MQLIWLKSFLEVARSGNFTVAADKLNITQSAVSKHIRSLEDSWGVQLFDRKNFRLTLAGHSVYEHARRINTEMELLDRDIKEIKEQENRIIRIAAIPAFGSSSSAAILDEFRKSHPDIIFQFYETGMEQALEQLRFGIVDFAFVRINLMEPNKQFQKIPIQRDNVIMLCDTKNSLSRRDTVSMKEMEGRPLICVTMAIPEIDRLFRKFNQQLDSSQIVVSASNSQMIDKALHHDSGVGIMTNHLAELVDPDHTLKRVPLQEDPCFILGMVCLEINNRRIICREFRRFVREKYSLPPE